MWFPWNKTGASLNRFVIAGTNVTLRGTTDPQWGWVDGHGQAVSFQVSCQPCHWQEAQWWDAVQQTNRPHGWRVNSSGGTVVKDMKIWKVSQLCHKLIYQMNHGQARWLGLDFDWERYSCLEHSHLGRVLHECKTNRPFIRLAWHVPLRSLSHLIRRWTDDHKKRWHSASAIH